MGESVIFAGDHPYYLLVRSGGSSVVVDLDVRDWADQYPILEQPGTWLFCDKYLSDRSGRHVVRLAMVVAEGDRPYYRAKHIGALVPGAGEIVCYGIGKESPDGTAVRMWLMPNGMVVGSDDVFSLGSDLVRARL